MTDATPSQLQQSLMAEFETRGWEYDLAVGTDIVRGVADGQAVEPNALARLISTTWLERNGATRQEVGDAIDRAIGGLRLRREKPQTAVLNVDSRTYSLEIGAGAQITDSELNIGGTQINVRVDAPKGDVLAGVSALVRAGFAGDWNPEAARALGRVIDGRNDIDLADVETVVAEVAETQPTGPGRLRAMLQSIAAQGLSGALATGITTAIGALLAGNAF